MRIIVALSLLTLLGCGAKTGLPVPENTTCREIELERPIPQVLFAVDRSGSMDFSLTGIEPDDPRRGDLPSRWTLMSAALTGSLAERTGTLEFGALFYPEILAGDPSACGGAEVVSIVPGEGTPEGLRNVFESTTPIGGTPTGGALRVAREFFAEPEEGTVPFVVLVTDGAPNCNPEPATPPPACICTSPDPTRCDPVENADAPLQCLDAGRALDELNLLSGAGVPTFVLGITRQADLVEVLDTMAVAGGRPRTTGPRRYYDAQTEAELNEALDAINDSITSCAFTLSAPSNTDRFQVLLAGEPISRDPSHMSGWDFTNDSNTVISLYGEACRRAEDLGIEVRADLYCDGESPEMQRDI